MRLPLWVYAIATAVGLWAGAAYGGVLPSQYDREIKTAAQRYMPIVPWQVYWGQLYQESRMDPAARSPAGAEGLAQFMPGTAADIFPLLGYSALDRRLASPSILAGALYMSRMRSIWTADRPEHDKHNLALASYNAGAGNILAAQRLCGGNLYAQIMACLPEITGRHAAETLGYAPAIRRWAAAKMIGG